LAELGTRWNIVFDKYGFQAAAGGGEEEIRYCKISFVVENRGA
jgi:hypothetical protein